MFILNTVFPFVIDTLLSHGVQLQYYSVCILNIIKVN